MKNPKHDFKFEKAILSKDQDFKEAVCCVRLIVLSLVLGSFYIIWSLIAW